MEPFNIVLVAPEIPQNTGSIGRMCVETGCRLHLIEPLGFSLDEKHLRRAGMDYWPRLDVTVYPGWEDFLNCHPGAELLFASTKGEKCYWDAVYPPGCWLVFGRESAGLPPEFYSVYRGRLITVPMPGDFTRSLNLATSAGIVLYEALRQNRCRWDGNGRR